MTTQLVVSHLAEADTVSILGTLATAAGRAVAEKYARAFEALYDRLLAYPESGPLRSVLGPQVRIGVIAPFVIIYDYDRVDDRVMILRLLDGRREISEDLLRQR